MSMPDPSPGGGAVDRRLLDAVVAVADGLELAPTLRRIIRAARDLTGARYAALGVLGEDGLHSSFVYTGMDREAEALIGHLPHGLGVLGHITRVGRAVRTDEVSRHPASTGFPAGHPPMHSFLGVPVGIAERVIGNLYLAEKEGGFTAEDEDVVVALAAAAAVAVENARLYADVQRRARWMAAAQQVSTAMISGADEEDALKLIAERAAQLADADGAVLVLPGLGNDWVLEIAVGDKLLDGLVGTVMPAQGRAMSVLRSGVGIRVGELAREARLQVEGLRTFGPALYAPLVAREEPIGVLILLRRVGGNEFTDADLATAQTFAGQAAISLQLADGRRRAEEAELLQERARIARDLHDLVVQELFAMGMRLTKLRGRLEPGVLVHVDSSLDSLDRVVRQIRSTIRALRDPEEPTSLVDRVHAETARAQSLLGFAAQVEASVAEGVDAGGAVPPEVVDDVVAVIREGLSNAARHAKASTVLVRVSLDERHVCVQVADNGVGIPAKPGRRSGLDNLGERARRHGGTFEAVRGVGESAARPGTVLAWRVPLGQAADSPPAGSDAPGTRG